MKSSITPRIAALMARATAPAKAYSYLRFSTPDQMKGDSLRRQTEAAQAYAKERKLDLDEELSLRDLGVSAFRGSNAAKDAALGQFLYAIEKGVVQAGSFLLVENIDRLSRREAWDALTILQSIVNKGVTVVTLMDRQEYSRERMLREPWCMLQAYGAMIRAHEESATKSKRAKEAYRSAVEKARRGEGLVSSKYPSWLRYNIETKSFEVIPERREVVRRIFTLAKQGVGKDSIAHELNSTDVPTFSHGKRWYSSFIFKLLNNRAVLGELNPNEREYGADGSRKLLPLGTIKAYYPAIISKRDFEQVATLSSASRSPRRGRHAATVSNVLGGLAKCPKCGEAMTRVNKGANGGLPYLVCVNAKTGAGCRYHIVNYRNIENAIFEQVSQIVGDAPAASKKAQEIEAELEGKSRDHDEILEAMDRLTRVAESGAGNQAPTALRGRLIELETEVQSLAQEIEGLRLRLRDMGSTIVSQRLKELKAALSGPRDLERANTAMRLLMDSVIVDYASGMLRFHWRHGPSTRLVFEFPDPARTRRGRKPGAGSYPTISIDQPRPGTERDPQVVYLQGLQHPR